MYTQKDVVNALTDYKNGVPLKEITRKYGISRPTIYFWTKKTGLPSRNTYRIDWEAVRKELEK